MTLAAGNRLGPYAPPTGPLGAACFLAAAAYLEFAPGQEPQRSQA